MIGNHGYHNVQCIHFNIMEYNLRILKCDIPEWTQFKK